jgi:hypothetical protein
MTNFGSFVTTLRARHFLEFAEDEIATICLLHVLKLKQSPMNAFKPLMLWHLWSSKKIREHKNLGTTEHFIGRKRIIKNLIKQYNFAKLPFQKVVKLPVSGSVVKTTCHDAKASIQRLFTDPRIDPEIIFTGTEIPPKDLLMIWITYKISTLARPTFRCMQH